MLFTPQPVGASSTNYIPNVPRRTTPACSAGRTTRLPPSAGTRAYVRTPVSPALPGWWPPRNWGADGIKAQELASSVRVSYARGFCRGGAGGGRLEPNRPVFGSINSRSRYRNGHLTPRKTTVGTIQGGNYLLPSDGNSKGKRRRTVEKEKEKQLRHVGRSTRRPRVPPEI